MAFINAYFRENMNGTRAYLSLHPQITYESAGALASLTLKNVNVSGEITRRLDEMAMPLNEALARKASIARAALLPFVRVDEDGFVYFNFADPDAKANLHIIKKIKSKRERRVEGKGEDAETWEGEWVEVELHDANSALTDILRMHGKFIEKTEATGAASAPTPLVIPARSIAKSFSDVLRDIEDRRHTEYLFFGGRGSTKSSFVSLAVVELLVNNPTVHALALRQVKDTMRDSIYSQLDWAVRELGQQDKFKLITSPMEIEYLPTHQKIYFRGADDVGKIKSIKPPFGHVGILWFEELDSFHGAEAVRNVEQSAIRGGDEAWIFKSWNPPRTASNWANKYRLIPKESQLQHASNFLDVPPEWLGQVFLDEAEHLKSVNPGAYAHEYMGEANSSGGQVFENVKLRKITNAEIAQFDRLYFGIDFGYFPDPFAYVKCYYNAAQLKLYIFDEYKANKRSNRLVYDDLVKDHGLTPEDMVIADSSEPKSVADFRDYGASIRGAEKGPQSVEYSMKWLQSLSEIVIDNTRCPYSAQEFTDYELEQDKAGEYISAYPDKNNHFIDAARYALNTVWKRRGQ